MARQTRIREKEIAQAKQPRDTAKSIADFRKALSVILAAELGLDADRTADILGTSRRTVFRHRNGIRNQDDTPPKSWGGRRRCCMSIEEEQAFLGQSLRRRRVDGSSHSCSVGQTPGLQRPDVNYLPVAGTARLAKSPAGYQAPQGGSGKAG